MDSAGSALKVTVTIEGEASERCSTCLPNLQTAALAIRSAAESAGNRAFSTAQPTPPNGATSPQPFVFIYTATDALGQTASVNRTVTVLDPCTAPESWCSNPGECNMPPVYLIPCKTCTSRVSCLSVGACSKFGICLPSTSSNTAPNLTLDTSILGLTVQVNQSSTYAACSSGIKPSLAAPCEPGGSATDTQDGNLTASILACPPSRCLSTYCTGKAFFKHASCPCCCEQWPPQSPLRCQLHLLYIQARSSAKLVWQTVPSTPASLWAHSSASASWSLTTAPLS